MEECCKSSLWWITANSAVYWAQTGKKIAGKQVPVTRRRKPVFWCGLGDFLSQCGFNQKQHWSVSGAPGKQTIRAGERNPKFCLVKYRIQMFPQVFWQFGLCLAWDIFLENEVNQALTEGVNRWQCLMGWERVLPVSLSKSSPAPPPCKVGTGRDFTGTQQTFPASGPWAW